jgi:hypothetical protein
LSCSPSNPLVRLLLRDYPCATDGWLLLLHVKKTAESSHAPKPMKDWLLILLYEAKVLAFLRKTKEDLKRFHMMLGSKRKHLTL